jgi:hypothetical protein
MQTVRAGQIVAKVGFWAQADRPDHLIEPRQRYFSENMQCTYFIKKEKKFEYTQIFVRKFSVLF